ncbi:SDR family oxidoreductase [Mumia sp. ZJ1417]|uniref:SDR family oxidoreductase n=1 Tax=Mumia sp. ZJ1417 TaxID=2708082 RepID=UPI001FBB57C9|nr:SDR family oxidoreductase [Mumia sp. ZJ1417]
MTIHVLTMARSGERHHGTAWYDPYQDEVILVRGRGGDQARGMTTTATTTTTALVTGANKGIGLETVRRLAGLGWTVWLGSRDAELGRKAAEPLQSEGLDVRPVVIDVTDDASVATAVATVEDAGTGLDVLVNNAGIGGSWAGPADTVPADFIPVFGVNVLGPVRVTHAFLPMLRASEHPRVVNVSSGVGSFAVTSDPSRLESTLVGLVYPSSKAALNLITTMYAKALPEFRVNAVDPGYTATDLNGHRGTQTVEEGAAASVRAATVDPQGPTGAFFGRDGFVPW